MNFQNEDLFLQENELNALANEPLLSEDLWKSRQDFEKRKNVFGVLTEADERGKGHMRT